MCVTNEWFLCASRGDDGKSFPSEFLFRTYTSFALTLISLALLNRNLDAPTSRLYVANLSATIDIADGETHAPTIQLRPLGSTARN